MKNGMHLVGVLFLCGFVVTAQLACSGDLSEDEAAALDDEFSPVGSNDQTTPIPNSPVNEEETEDLSDESSEPGTQPLQVVEDDPVEDDSVEDDPVEDDSVQDDPVDSGSEDTLASGEPDPEPIEPPEEEATNGAIVVSSQFPSAMNCGEVVMATVEMHNTGTTTWTRADGYKLGTVDDEDPFHETTREWLPEDAVIPPNASWVFEFELLGPGEEGVYTSDWRMVHEGVEWFGESVAHEITVNCDASAWEFTDEMEDAVYDSAVYVRNNFPQFFNLEDLDNYDKRVIAYDMMTTVINDIRAKGVDASRCVANPGLPPSDPFLWCSDALVVGPPGEAVTLDVYQSWSAPANPQVLITTPQATGVVTDDLIPLP